MEYRKTAFLDSSDEDALNDFSRENDPDDSKIEKRTRIAPVNKRLKFQEVDEWRPSAFEHCLEGTRHLKESYKKREIFQYIWIQQQDMSSSNFKLLCMCCGVTKTTSSDTFMSHFTNDECLFTKVPSGKRVSVRTYVKRLALARAEAYGRAKSSEVPEASMARADKKHQRIEERVSKAVTNDNFARQSLATLFLACNLPAHMAESPFLRDFAMLLIQSGTQLSYLDLERAWNRKSVSEEMDIQAKCMADRSKKSVEANAKSFGSTLLVDTWTAKRCIGTIGVSVSSLDRFHACPIVLSDTTRSNPDSYVEKLDDVVDWSDVYFVCTDGSSDMLAIAKILNTTKHIVPVLCTAHGLSLIVHYIGKVFEECTSLFSKASDIIAFFNPCPRWMELLRKGQDVGLGFLPICKTRMAYQTLVLLRVLRLRKAARKACIDIAEYLDDAEDEHIDIFSNFAQVQSTLNDDSLFQEIEAFCRITLPVLLAMREADKGSPMAGFVYWLHYHVEVQVGLVLENLNGKVSNFAKLKKEVLSAVRYIWDKRHSPMHSFAYLTNPVLHADLSHNDAFGLDDNFTTDIDEVAECMLRKRYEGRFADEEGEPIDEDYIMKKVIRVKNELLRYLSPDGLDIRQKAEAKSLLASHFWKVSTAARIYPTLAWCATRVHAAAIVTSKLDRYFSHVGNVQTENRSNLAPDRAALYVSAHSTMITGSTNFLQAEEIHGSLVGLVKRCEGLETDRAIFEFETNDGFSDLEQWISEVTSKNLTLLYSDQGIDVAGCSTIVGEVLEEFDFDAEFAKRDNDASILRKSNRNRRQPKKLNL